MKDKLYIRTFGCQMNDRDSEALLGLFLDKGYVAVDTPDEADVILVNTCAVREHAEGRVMSLLGTFKKLFDTRHPCLPAGRRPDTRRVVGLIGCMARNRGEEILRKMPHVDLVVGPAHFAKVPEYIATIQSEGLRLINLEDGPRSETLYHPLYRFEQGRAQVVISTGCDNHCSYCVVPFVRGHLRPRPPQDIIDEVRRNLDLGITRITLLGQNVNDYDHGGTGFVGLLRSIDAIEGIEELDFMTSHPKNTSRDLFRFMADSRKIKGHLHLPFQSGSDRILKLMNRGYTRQDYLGLVADYAAIVAGTVGTDVIVGYPTESEEDFLKTKDILERVRFRHTYIFKYSPRPHTRACASPDDVPKEEKKRRHKILLELQKKISLSMKITHHKSK
ncbi:MiaB/RimO family radical SAM methylthiotransferase [Candidatus Omnitrophota bacterium]